jgi:hypothetical protein
VNGPGRDVVPLWRMRCRIAHSGTTAARTLDRVLAYAAGCNGAPLFREVAERFLTGFIDLRLDHKPRGFTREFRGKGWRNRRDAVHCYPNEVGHDLLMVGKGYERAALLREYHLSKIGARPQQPYALLPFSCVSVLHGDRIFLESRVQVTDVP